MSVNVSIHCDAEPADITVSGATCNPHVISLSLGRYGSDGYVYLNPEQARRVAAVLLADVTRCETWHAERALAQPAPVAADLDEVLF